jgi:predicted glycosyltransferase involved in capsule biosynthesis
MRANFFSKLYKPHPEAWIISCYYNPLRFASRARNFEIFYRKLTDSKVRFLIVECAFGGEDFSLSVRENVIKVRARDVLWQKERLLNLAERLLPPKAKYVIWLDADILFSNRNWIRDTVEVLQTQTICQPFSRCVRLLPGQTAPDASNQEVWESFAYVRNNDARKAADTSFDVHGHTGFAWAARREVFSEIGLYDRAIAGTADHLMAHAATGQTEHPCINRAFFSDAIKTHFRRWGKRFFEVVEGKLGFIEGDIYHLWHGELKNRRYLERTRELSRLNFDPLTDLVVNEHNVYEFAPERDDLRLWMRDYFRRRLEDEAAVENIKTDLQIPENFAPFSAKG